jgi:hypothetical protein
MYSSRGFSDMTRRGFPHSGIHGSTPACGSPWLIAANHALLRLLTPRHPPSALSSLTTNLLPSSFESGCGVEAKVRFSRHSANLYDSRFVLLFDCQRNQWRIRDSNPRPQACKARALPTELIPHRERQGRALKTEREGSEIDQPLSDLGYPRTNSRKEVIQPQVPLRLPCYDFTPVTSHSLGTTLPCGLGKPLLEQLTPMV